MKNIKYPKILLLGISLLLISCQKEFLEKKPATNLNVPTSLSDMRLLLDNTSALNRSPVIGEASADDYYMTFGAWQNQYSPKDANIYVWAKEIWSGKTNIPDWNKPYNQVLYANVVLEQLSKVNRHSSNAIEYDNVKGNALFLRAWSFFDLAQVFALPYDHTTYNSDMGIPLRLSADINIPSTRSSLKQTYDQILKDALAARELISTRTSTENGNRPSKVACYAFLSRIYLTMREYDKSGLYADSALQITSTLMDYNTLDTTSMTPFKYNNIEVLYQNYLVDINPIILVNNSVNYSIDSLLYNSYESNDLRKTLYFAKNQGFTNKKNTYSGSTVNSNGIATDELVLTMAECLIRQGKIVEGIDQLNKLLVTRYRIGTYINYQTASQEQALDKVLLERRKELVMRGLRWNDIRRLNKEGKNIILKRILNGQTYILSPSDIRYALPIPPDVISLSGMQQNPR